MSQGRDKYKNVNVSLAYDQYSAKQFLTKEPLNFLAEYQSCIELSKTNLTQIHSTAIIPFSSDGMLFALG